MGVPGAPAAAHRRDVAAATRNPPSRTNTGIEVTFDQDGVVDAASHMTIEPEDRGRFEQHGRTLAFVPAKPLATSRRSTPSPSAAASRSEGPARSSRPTSASGSRRPPRAPRPRCGPPSSSPTTCSSRRRPTGRSIAVWVFQDWADGEPDPKPPTTARIEVYRLRDLDAAIEAFRQVRDIPALERSMRPWTSSRPRAWIESSRSTPGSGIRTAPCGSELPRRLPAGWYVITLRSGHPADPGDAPGDRYRGLPRRLGDEDARLGERPCYGRTAQDGDSARPAALTSGVPARTDPRRDTPAGICLNSQPGACTDDVRPGPHDPGRQPGGVPARERTATAGGRRLPGVRTVDPGFAVLAHVPHRPHAVSAHGHGQHLGRRARSRHGRGPRVGHDPPVRGRLRRWRPGTGAPLVDDRSPPERDSARSRGRSPSTTCRRATTSSRLRVADRRPRLARRFQVDRILKPAYRLEVTHRAAGLLRRATRSGSRRTPTFYEGSPVPGIPLRLDGVSRWLHDRRGGHRDGPHDGPFDADEDTTAARRSVRSRSIPPERRRARSPARAARSSSSRATGPSPATAADRGRAGPRDGQPPRGRPRSPRARDRRREMRLGRSTPRASRSRAGPSPPPSRSTSRYRTKTGTRYDFIEKKVVPMYEYRSTERAAGTVRVTTDNDGTFSVSIRASGSGHAYRVRADARPITDKHAAHLDRWRERARDRGHGRPSPR